MSSQEQPTEFDFAFRPENYVDVDDPISALLVNVKGALRREMIRDIVSGRAKERARKSGDGPIVEAILSQVEPSIMDESLEDPMQLGRIHPAFMGGEFLPDRNPQEVEIARLELKSTTADVISVRAQRTESGYQNRVVDEYEVAYTHKHVTSTQPLSLREVIELIDSIDDGEPSARGDDFPSVLRNYNADCSADFEGLVDFVTVSSEFYPQLKEYYEEQAREWLRRSLEEYGEDEEE